MASSSSASSRNSSGQQKEEVAKLIRSHQVALAELSSLSSSPVSNIKGHGVYQKNGNIYFRTTVQKATASEQKLLDQAKSQLRQLNA